MNKRNIEIWTTVVLISTVVIIAAVMRMTTRIDGDESYGGAQYGDEPYEESELSEAVRKPEGEQRSEAVWELEAGQMPELATHVCSGTDGGTDGGSTVAVLAAGEQEPSCFYGANYDVKCGDCGQSLGVRYREPLGHMADEGEVTCQPDCTGGGSIKYTCVRCGAEWSGEYGQIQPHAWVEGRKRVTDWENGGTKEMPYLHCSVCGKREGSE